MSPQFTKTIIQNRENVFQIQPNKRIAHFHSARTQRVTTNLHSTCTTFNVFNSSPNNRSISLQTQQFSKTCLKRPLKRTPKIGFQYWSSLNGGQKYCRMQYFFRPPLSYNFPLRPWFCLFLSGRLKQVLL